MRRLLAVLGLLLATAPAALAATTTRTTTSRATTQRATAPDSTATGTTHLTELQVLNIAGVDARVSDVQLGHALAIWSAKYDPITRLWVARLKEPAKPVLAFVTVRDADGTVVEAHKAPGDTVGIADLKKPDAERLAGQSPKVRDWLGRYTSHGIAITSQTSYDAGGAWTRHWWAGGAEIARVTLDDKTRRITAAWTGPQVAWSMARGSFSAFGKRINDPWIFGTLLLVFAVGLIDWRRLASLRTLDVVALSSFSVSLWCFNKGLVFWSVPLAYPPLLYLLARLVAVGCGRTRRVAYVTRWPVWLIAALAVFAMGFRTGLNYWSSNVIDVGLASVAGSARILDGESPYGNMPKPTAATCGIRYSDGSYSAYKQRNGRCESAVEQGDTYGPSMYLAYVPVTAAVGFSGRWDELPAAHAAAWLYDALAAAGLTLAAFRLGGRRLAATALFFWATYPFTVYAMSSNSNDPLVAAFVAWTLALFTWPFFRGLLGGFAAWAKFAPLLLLGLLVRADRRPYRDPPEWSYTAGAPPQLARPGRVRRLLQNASPGRSGLLVLVGFACATAIAFGVYLPLRFWSFHTFYDRTFGFQLDRRSPFSIWDWRDYPGFPDLATEKRALWLGLIVFSAALYVFPRRLDLTRAAALAGAVLVGFHIVLTHWFYLYIPWFVPCVAIALLAPRSALERSPALLPASARVRSASARLPRTATAPVA